MHHTRVANWGMRGLRPMAALTIVLLNEEVRDGGADERRRLPIELHDAMSMQRATERGGEQLCLAAVVEEVVV